MVLTFEKIHDMERAERENKELQKLPDNIINELNDYIHRKERINESDILETENVKNIIKRLFELREYKIANMALYSVRTGVPPKNMLDREEETFNAMKAALEKFRQDLYADLDKKRERKEYFVVKKTIPEIVGPDMKKYRLNKGDKVVLPKSLNDLLLKEGVIERVEG